MCLGVSLLCTLLSTHWSAVHSVVICPVDVTKSGDGERGTGNGERGTWNGERGTGNGERGTGNGEQGTENGEREIGRASCRERV